MKPGDKITIYEALQSNYIGTIKRGEQFPAKFTKDGYRLRNIVTRELIYRSKSKLIGVFTITRIKATTCKTNLSP